MFSLPDLPYSFDALEPYIDEETMKIHHDKHHAAYVNNLNEALKSHDDLLSMEIDELLKKLDKVPVEIRTKIKNNAGGHANHSLFWTIMSKGSSEPSGELSEAIKLTFGDLTTFMEKFTQAGMGRFGSGWAWLVTVEGKLEIVDSPNQDSPVSDGKTPILGLDVWEHAYYLKYQNRRADYIAAWWKVVNWEAVKERFLKLI